jgi:hypothetical protein
LAPVANFLNILPYFQGLTKLIDNPLTHPMLKILLPQMSSCFHDVSEKVRVAFVDLLLKVKMVKALKVGACLIISVEIVQVFAEFRFFLSKIAKKN